MAAIHLGGNKARRPSVRSRAGPVGLRGEVVEVDGAPHDVGVREEDAVLAEGEGEAEADGRVGRGPRAAAGGDGGARRGVGEVDNNVAGEDGCLGRVAREVTQESQSRLCKASLSTAPSVERDLPARGGTAAGGEAGELGAGRELTGFDGAGDGRAKEGGGSGEDGGELHCCGGFDVGKFGSFGYLLCCE